MQEWQIRRGKVIERDSLVVYECAFQKVASGTKVCVPVYSRKPITERVNKEVKEWVGTGVGVCVLLQVCLWGKLSMKSLYSLLTR